MSLPPTRPKQKPNLNWRSLPIGPSEAFVLSQLDGTVEVTQLVFTTGLPEGQLREILDRLFELGAIEGWTVSASDRSRVQSSPSKPPPPRTESNTPAEPLSSPLQLSPLRQSQERAAAPAYDVRLLDEPADLEIEFKAQILELEAKLQRASHYDLLGVSANAEKRAVKDAFFTLINLYHVDKYFGKDLGIFRSKLERISTALTKAHDTLSRNKTRAEYDAYLASRRETRGIRDSLPPSNYPSAPPDVDAFIGARRAGAATTSDNSGLSESEPSGPEARESEPSGPDPSPLGADDSNPGTATPTVLDPNLQRRLLARRLGLRPAGAGSDNPNPEPQVDPYVLRERVAKDMKARYDVRHGEAQAQAQMYVDMAKTAQSEKNWGSAINALRVAQGLTPDSTEIKELLIVVTATADRELANKFADQAKYEQRDGYYDRAMRSYERAGRGKESAGQLEDAARFFHEAAICAGRDGSDPKKIAELARRAVAANGKKVEYRLDLARAYERLGMRSSALGEVQRAIDLDPQNQAAQALQKQLR